MMKQIRDAIYRMKPYRIMTARCEAWMTVEGELLYVSRTYLRMRRHYVHETDEGYKRDAADPHGHLLQRPHRLHETHFRSVPDAGEMLLTVRVSYELNIDSC